MRIVSKSDVQVRPKSDVQVHWFRHCDEWCVILVGQSFSFVSWAPGHLDMDADIAYGLALAAVRAERDHSEVRP